MPYTVRQLARLSGVSVRALHHYDETGLLRPASRSAAGYRLYGDKELLRLQQILFYRALNLPLHEIGKVLQASEFDTLNALLAHRTVLLARQKELSALLTTVDNTVARLQGDLNMPDMELYAGFPKEVMNLREEAIEKYGADTVLQSERSMSALSSRQLQSLLDELQAATEALASSSTFEPDSEQVQGLVDRHYAIIRRLWGTSQSTDKQAQAYAGLGQLYVDDERFLRQNGKPRPSFARFLRDAMGIYSARLQNDTQAGC
jgi:DNA-binding transcriptional MerR regulator